MKVGRHGLNVQVMKGLELGGLVGGASGYDASDRTRLLYFEGMIIKDVGFPVLLVYTTC